MNEGNIEAVCFGVKLNSICPDLKMFCHFYFVSSIYTDAFGHKVLFSTSLVASCKSSFSWFIDSSSTSKSQ